MSTEVKNGLIRLESVSKSFGSLLVLDSVDLSIEKGHTTVVIGRSGCGKSVMLKHITCLLRPDTGQVFFDGRRIDQFSERQLVPIRRKVGFLFQMNALFDSLTAGQNVAFPLQEHTTLSKEEIERIVATKLGLVGLSGVQAKKPAELSGGMRKRVALARAIALDPSVILYDEPTTGLDPVTADVINELILKLQRELGVTSIVVTHDMNSAYKVGDRIVMLYQGKIIADGSPDEIRSSPDKRVQRFITGQADERDLLALGLKSPPIARPADGT